MMADDRNHERERILDGILDSILEAPEEEIDQDLCAAGDDPDVAADRLRVKLERTVERHRFHRRARPSLALEKPANEE